MKTMSSFMKMTIHYFSLILAILIIVFLSKRRRTQNPDKAKPLPPTPPSLPVVGHLHLLTGGAHHRSLASLSGRYGPTFRLQLGRRPFLVVSSPDAAEQCFSGGNDVVFANRPPFIVGDHLGYNFSIVPWASYGGLWRKLRRLLTVMALTGRRIGETARLRREEIRAIVKEWVVVAGSGRVKVDLNAAFMGMVRNLETRMVCGKRWEEGGPAGGEIFRSPPLMGPCDFLPAVRWVGYGGVERRLVEIQRKRDGYLQGLIDEFRGKMVEEEGGGGRRKKTTMVEELLVLQKDEPEFYTDKMIKGILLVMFTAGTDTTVRTTEWAMSLLLNHPAALHKVRAEVDTHVGFTRLVDDSDVSRFTYLRCVIYETLRLFPVVPLLLPHLSSSDTTIDGYHVPKGTILLVNVWALHRNPKVWEDPLKFKPERFLGVEGTREGFKFMPFGAGRRTCPGANLAMKVVELALATMVQCFEWEKVEDEAFGAEEKSGGITMSMGQPLQAFCTPRRCMAEVLSKLVEAN